MHISKKRETSYVHTLTTTKSPWTIICIGEITAIVSNVNALIGGYLSTMYGTNGCGGGLLQGVPKFGIVKF
jgi:hypothetical protein